MDGLANIDFTKIPETVGIVGSRSFADHPKGDMVLYKMVKRFMKQLNPKTIIVSGGARGIDSYAEDVAKNTFKMKTMIYSPQPKSDSRRDVVTAIHERNTQIVRHLDDARGVLVAFNDEDRCDGTQSTVKKAVERYVPVIEFTFNQRGEFQFAEIPSCFFPDEKDNDDEHVL